MKQETEGRDGQLPIVECFVSMPFHHEFDDVFLKGISPIAAHLASKYTVDMVRLDREVYSKRQVEENVLRHIDASDLLIADITKYKENIQPKR